ncbi:MAG: hypothetical protein KAT07_05250 [Calditrichia bacterium]|nr:hypothetical protein [Calditrichia bacterium]
MFIPVGKASCKELKGTESDSVRYLHPIFENVDIEKDIVFGEVVNYKAQIFMYMTYPKIFLLN